MLIKTYNKQSNDAFGVTTGRLSMVRQGLALCVFVVTVATGCVDNEQSFYIEHMKKQPDMPDCTVSPGDESSSLMSVNLLLAHSPSASFQVANALIGREDYGNLRAESNGIMVDGYEVYTIDPTRGVVGGRQYYTYVKYLPPESTDLLHAQVMSPPAINEMLGACPRYSAYEIASAIFYRNMVEDDVRNGRQSSQATENGNAAGAIVISALAASVDYPERIYSVVRFLGHTQGGKEVETPEFTVPIVPYCGVTGGWAPCLNNICVALCNANATPVESCSDGVDAPMTCSDFLAGNSEFKVKYDAVDPETLEPNHVEETVCDHFCP